MRPSARALLLLALAAGGCPDRDPIAAPTDAMPGLPDAPPPPDAGPDAWEARACQDGEDNDGDGLFDFPFDPGCMDGNDGDEADDCPSGPLCPACANEVDDDADGDIDERDPGCDHAADQDEYNLPFFPCTPAVPVLDITLTGVASGTFTGGPNSLESPVCGGLGTEVGFTYTISAGPATLMVSTDDPFTTVDTVIYVRAQCWMPSTELGCDDDGGSAPGTSLLTLPNLPVGTYYIIVDTFGPGSLGHFELTVTEVP
jgi:hypothetical protein